MIKQTRHSNASLLREKNKFNKRYSEAVQFRDAIHKASKRRVVITHTLEERELLKKMKKSSTFSNELVYKKTQ